MNRYLKLFHILSDRSFLRALANGVVASTEHLYALKDLGCALVVDVGANRGQFALLARHLYPSARVISFEPLPEAVAVFRRLFESDPQVILHESAIGPREQTMKLHVAHADDSSSLLPMTPLQQQLFPGTAEKEIRTVRVRPMDAFLCAEEIQKPALLKVDVQGFEKEVLEGCRSLLHLISYVCVECSFVELYAGQSLAQDVIAFLGRSGFALIGIHNISCDKHGNSIQADFLFRNENWSI